MTLNVFCRPSSPILVVSIVPSRASETILSLSRNNFLKQEIIMEEGIQNYNIGGFHPVRLGEVYGNKYKIFQKLGYGRYSTVWLVRHEQ